jgi:DNA-binding protein H-NS
MARLSYENIQKQIQKLQEQAKKLEASRDAKKLKAVAQVNALMKKLNLSIEDLKVSPTKPGRSKPVNGSKTARQKKTGALRPPVPPKYRDELSGQTWTGRGKPPVWLKNFLDQGRTKEDFLIDKTANVLINMTANELSAQ